MGKMKDQGVIMYEYILKKYRPKKINCPHCKKEVSQKPHREKMVDVATATKIIEMAYESDGPEVIIVVSGDKDLIPAVKLVREKLGKIVIVVGYRHYKDKRLNCLSWDLAKEADEVINAFDL